MSQKLWSVTSLVRYLKTKLDNDFAIQRIYLKAELSNFTNHRSGHWYFSLKDESSRVACVMFATNAARCPVKPLEGMKVLVQVNTSIYEGNGQLQLIVQSMEEEGVGEYYLKFEQLKVKLNQEGLFAPEHKKPLVAYPSSIIVISGAQSAARKDVLTTLKRRWPIASIIEFNPLVQGNQASEQIIEAITKADTYNADCIILARGGGSIEDLWCFNNEDLARCIYACNTVIITGIGHEVDTTLADYVSDLRAPTPTGAAELATPNFEEVLQHCIQLKMRLRSNLNFRLSLLREKLQKLRKNKHFMEPTLLYQNQMMKLALMNQRLDRFVGKVQIKQFELRSLQEQLFSLSQRLVQQNKATLIHNQTMLNERVIQNLKGKQKQIAHCLDLLEAYSPLKILSRGYSLVYSNNQLIHSINEVQLNQEISIRLSDGEIIGKIVKKEELT